MSACGILLLTVGACLLEQILLVSVDWAHSKVGFCMYKKKSVQVSPWALTRWFNFIAEDWGNQVSQNKWNFSVLVFYF